MRHMLWSAALIAAMSLSACSDDDDNGDTTPPPEPVVKKNLVFFLGDGYGIVPMTAARVYAVGETGSLAIDEFPETALVKTFSNDAQVTDSAPSMSAYMTGVKMNNEVLSMTPETVATNPTSANSNCAESNGDAVTTLLELAEAAGRSTGVVTTTKVTHATPAATYAHVCHRDAENTIAAQLVPGGAGYNAALGDGLEVVLGGGWQHFLPQTDAAGSSRTDTRNLVDELKAKGYLSVSNTAELNAAPATTGKLVGLFTRSHMNYDIDRDPAAEPSLAEMTGKAIDLLSRNEKGFFLMVEGGRIDHALHSTQARKSLQDAKAFDDAIKLAIEKIKAFDPELENTLIVVTADHDHTMVMNGYAAVTGPTTDASPGILGLLRSYADPSQPAKDSDGMPFTTLVFGNGENRVAGKRSTMAALTDAEVFDKNYHQEAAVRMPAGSETHGGADVFLGAMGLGAAEFHGVMDNTEVFGLCKSAVGL